MTWNIFSRLSEKIGLWLNEPIGDAGIVADSTATELKKPQRSFQAARALPKGKRGRGSRPETTKPIREFHPRGAAGRREVRGPSGAHKAVMPHKGNHPRYSK